MPLRSLERSGRAASSAVGATIPATMVSSPAPHAASASVDVDALSRALCVVGDRWSLAIVSQLATAGPQRFSDLAGAVAPIARTVLSERLRRLDEAGVIEREQYCDAPVRFSYRLTTSGTALAATCASLATWSRGNLTTVH